MSLNYGTELAYLGQSLIEHLLNGKEVIVLLEKLILQRSVAIVYPNSRQRLRISKRADIRSDLY